MPASRATIYTRENLSAAVAKSASYREVMRHLGLPVTGGGAAHVARRIKDFEIDVTHFSSLRASPEPLPRFGRDELATALAGARSLADLARRLDLPVTTRTRRHLTHLVAEHGLSMTDLGHRRIRLDPEEVRRAVESCTSLVGVMRLLGLTPNRTNYRRVRTALTDHGIETGHFTRSSWAAPRVRRRAPTRPEDVLRIDGQNRRTSGQKLRSALAAAGVPGVCAGCGMDGTWQGRRLTLEVDHINGDFRDNRKENLRLLCPNCHATTDTYCGRNRARVS